MLTLVRLRLGYATFAKTKRLPKSRSYVHPVPNAILHDQWLSQNPDCILCSRPKRERDKKALHPPADSFLRVCKPTEGQGWVHLACAVFIPEISFSDAKRLRIVEGISTLPTHRWSTVRSSPPFAEPRIPLSPSVFVQMLTSQLLSDVRFATKLMARSSGAATVPQSTTSLARGPAGTNLALRSNR